MNTVKGTIRPLKDKILVAEMNFDEQRTTSGIIITSDNGKSHGVKPRWGRVWAVGPEQKEVQVGEWVYVEHGRWTRGIEVDQDGEEIVIRMVEPKAIMLRADEKPNDLYIGEEFDSSTSSNINPDDFITR
jgi:co-chaperonin GroES (HSP10)